MSGSAESMIGSPSEGSKEGEKERKKNFIVGMTGLSKLRD